MLAGGNGWKKVSAVNVTKDHQQKMKGMQDSGQRSHVGIKTVALRKRDRSQT